MSRIPKRFYKKYSEKLSFRYIPNHSQFQYGYLGITESYVSGILELHFPSDNPIHAKQIDITLIGMEYVCWKEKRHKKTITHVVRNPLISQGICVWNSPDDNYQPLTELQFPFRFELPDNLPSSVNFSREFSEIFYDLKATIKQESNILKFRGSTKSIIIRCPITRYSLPPTIPTPTQFSNYDDPSAISRGIGFFVSLEHYVFSELIPISIDFGLLFHKPDLEIKEIILGVKQYVRLIAGKEKRLKNYILKSVVKYNEIKNRLDSNNEYKANVKFEIPSRCDKKNYSVKHSVDMNYIKVSHKIKFKVKFGIFGGRYINWEKDIKIENMITEDLI
ncbi:9546_t:CDS:1 [Diversispora eburnea]|uniref:9546_t:CDS:1 n=1 Tax=Diversispora eburnea TaxID=1213867 RepID=A0A9N8V2Z5_9GLOM|nr:9546_t:CDS:1 [Diversispora eburnea]